MMCWLNFQSNVSEWHIPNLWQFLNIIDTQLTQKCLADLNVLAQRCINMNYDSHLHFVSCNVVERQLDSFESISINERIVINLRFIDNTVIMTDNNNDITEHDTAS